MKLTELQVLSKTSKSLDNKITIAVISNITFEPYFNTILQSKFLNNNVETLVLPISYDEYNSQENIEKLAKADYIIVCLNFDYLYPNMGLDIISIKTSDEDILIDVKKKCFDLYNKIKSQITNPIIWFGFEDYCYQYNTICGNIIENKNLVYKINNEVCSLLSKQSTYIDLKRIIAQTGITNSYNNKGKYRWNSPYSQALINEICNEIYKQHLVINGITKKCIVLDCDNVLWGGIISEDGIDNIALGNSGLGRSFQDFQRYLLYLYYHGVILAVCSKNDLTDVMTMFTEHSEMILKEKHIAFFQVNWDNKADNIKQISETLNIGLDSMVFIDDSDFEIQSIKSILPEVTAIKFERDYIYEKLSCFNLKKDANIEKINQRNETYKTNEKREKLKSDCKTFQQYIDSLEMKIDIHKAIPIELNRISELTQRTNKCTNGKRYTVEQLKTLFQNNNYQLYSVSLSDKFSDLGIVGTIGIDGKTLDLFSLSCRALGKNIEKQMILEILTNNIEKYYFISTGKNDVINSLLQETIIKK